MKKTPAPRPDLSFEQAYNGLVCGIDEAGRGPLAGPVVAACVHIPVAVQAMDFWTHVTDSKKLTAAKRDMLYTEIKTHAVFGIAAASPQEIDQLNIHHATLLAMQRAFEAMCAHISPIAALVDGKFGPQLPCPVQTVIQGDGKCLSIAAASILAKVTRDRHMRDLHNEFPHYGWDTNAGYPTAAHMDGIQANGICIYHRTSYAPIKALIEAA